MKNAKYETKYIIRRVLIGVLIAIILFNCKKCGVYALTDGNFIADPLSKSYSFSSSAPSSSFERLGEFPISSSNFNLYTTWTGTKGYYFYLHNTSDDTYLLYFVQLSTSNFSNVSSLVMNSSNSTFTVYDVDGNSLGMYGAGGGQSFALMFSLSDNLSTYFPSAFDSTNFMQYAFNYDNTNIYSIKPKSNKSSVSVYTPFNQIFKHLADSNTTWKLVSTSFASIYVDNNEVPNNNFPPTGYSEIDLTGYQGVFFVPKNYNDISCSDVGALCNTTFDYYYQEEVKESWFPLSNKNKISFSLDNLISTGVPSELKQTYYPLRETLVDDSIVYYAFMIYNYTNDGSPLQPNSYMAYGGAKVWYDSRLYDYYLVEDFNTYSQNICFYAGNNQICVDVKGLPTLKEAIEQAELEESLDDNNFKDANIVFEFLKFPFAFLSQLPKETCVSIQLPSLPFIGGQISLPCMSTIYVDVLGIYRPIISGAINFIIIYRFLVFAIMTYKKVLEPNDTTVEVANL